LKIFINFLNPWQNIGSANLREAKRFLNSDLDRTIFVIIEDIASHKFLDSKHILALHPEMEERSLQPRLHFLFHGGLVERPVSQFTYFQKSTHIV